MSGKYTLGGSRMGLLETAAATLIGAERRTEIAARNISNAQTPGYKREVAYSEIVAAADRAWSKAAQPVTLSVTNSVAGVLTDTGNPLDLAVSGDGYLLLRAGERFYLSRGGQFRRDSEGTLEDAQGRKVQQAGGGDLVLDTDTPDILIDGAVFADGVPVGNLATYRPDASLKPQDLQAGLSAEQAMALAESDAGGLRQGMLERSNVVLSDEMVGLIRNQRMGEAGAQMVRAYDELIGQAVATFGRRSG